MSNTEIIEDTKPSTRKKRGVQGKCKTCGSPIPAAKRLCPACRQQEQEAKDNIHTWKSPTGEAVKRQVEWVHVSGKVVFEISGRQFPIDSPSGPFLEALIGVCFQRPPYIRANDVARYASLIDSLMHFQSQLHGSPIMAAKDVPLKRLGLVVGKWVNSFFHEPHHPLMPHFALDTACFIAAHGEGTCLSSDRSLPAVLPPMVAGDFSIRCLDNPGFKNEFTQKLSGHRLALATVPEGGAVVGPDREWLGPGGRFLFAITRCFLSHSWNEYVDLETREKNPPDYDISNAMLPGQVLLDASGSITDSLALARSERERRLDAPLRWVTHSVRDTGDETVLLPVPEWA